MTGSQHLNPEQSPRISVIVVAMNEAHDIADCLNSVKDWCCEMIVFDSGSTDGTQDICRRLGARVFETDWPGDGPQKNRALDQASGDWVICLDADERISSGLRDELLKELASAKVVAFSTPRLSSFCGRQIRHCGWWPDRITRVFRRGAGRFSPVRTHTRLLLEGETKKLQHPILHKTMPIIDEGLDKANVYSREGAKSLHERGRKVSFAAAIGHGFWAFFRTYLLRLGILDGAHGFMISVLNAETAYYKYAKLWLLSQAERQQSGTRAQG